MRSATYPSSSYQYRASWRSRLTTWALTLICGLMLLYMLWQMGVIPPLAPELKDKTLTLVIPPKPVVSPTPAKKMTKTKEASGGASRTIRHPLRARRRPLRPSR